MRFYFHARFCRFEAIPSFASCIRKHLHKCEYPTYLCPTPPQLKFKNSFFGIYLFEAIRKSSLQTYPYTSCTVKMIQVGNTFPSMQAACEAIQRYVLNDGESYKSEKAEKKRYRLICKDANCTFCIWVFNLDKKGPTVTIYNLHTCSPAIHYKNKNAHLVKYLIEHHCSLVIDNPYITAT
jgi:hypothetical protein